MKILLVHDYYDERGGEGVVFEQESRLLVEMGHEVVHWTRDNAGATRADIAKSWGGIRSVRTRKDLAPLLEPGDVDLIHAHNIFPLITPTLYTVASRFRVPVVQTLHNFRMLCAIGILLREGRPCVDCLGGSRLPGLRHRCYRGALGPTLAATASSMRHRRLAVEKSGVAAFIVLTRFARTLFEGAGLPAERLHVKGNFADDPGGVSSLSSHTVLFVGRLFPEKGLDTLMAAWTEEVPGTLDIIGSGPLKDRVRSWADGLSNVTFLGRLERSDVLARMRDARALVFPSEWYEGFPMVVLEAMASGLPIVTPGLGGVGEIAPVNEVSVHYPSGEPGELREALKTVLVDPNLAARLGRAARRRFERHHTAEENGGKLERIYQSVLAGAHGSAMLDRI